MKRISNSANILAAPSVALLLTLVLASPAAYAGSPAVIEVADGVVAVADDGQCSLIEAIVNANQGNATHADCAAGSVAGSTIVLAEDASYILTAIDNADALGPTGLPRVSGSISIEGNGALVSPQGPPMRMFFVSPDGELSLHDLRLEGGSLGDPSLAGAAIYNQGSLVVSRVRFTGNSGAGAGGAIANEGELSVSQSTFANNGGGGPGGAILNLFGGDADVSHSTFRDNGCGGGGCALQNEGTAVISNSTLQNNGGPTAGGIRNIGTLTLVHVTLAASGGNPGEGNALLNLGTATMRNSMIAAPTVPLDCSGNPVNFEGVNIIQDGSCNCIAPNCLVDDPGLVELADNGGPTQTRALPPGSVAIDAADSTFCPADDQRGVSRPVGAGCDLGAYENEFVAEPELSLIPIALDFGEIAIGNQAELQTILTNTGNVEVSGLVVTVSGTAYSLVSSSCPAALAVDDSCAISVRFEPVLEGVAEGELQIESSELDVQIGELTGIGFEPVDEVFADRFENLD